MTLVTAPLTQPLRRYAADTHIVLFFTSLSYVFCLILLFNRSLGAYWEVLLISDVCVLRSMITG